MKNPNTPTEYLFSLDADGFLEAMRTFHSDLDAEQYLDCIHADLRFFTWELWKDRKLHQVAPLDRGEFDILRHVQYGEKKRGVLAPRGVGKTFFGTATTSCFRFRRDRHRRILVPSKSLGAMKEVASVVREWLDKVWFLQDLAPTRENRDTTCYFDLAGVESTKQPSFKAIGNEGMLEGNRAHSIFPDDIETKLNTKTFDSREELKRLVKEYINILYPDLPDQDDPEIIKPIDSTEVVFFGTVKHEETVYAELASRKYHFVTWTLAYPTPEEITGAVNMSPMLIKDIQSGRASPGQPVFPRRFGIDNIIEKQAEGYTEWSMEHQLQVTLAKSNRYPLRISDLIVMDVDPIRAPVSVAYGTQNNKGSTAIEGIPSLGFGNERLYAPVFIDKEWSNYSSTKVWIDPAGKGEDQTGIAAVGQLAGMLWVKGVCGFDGGASVAAMELLCDFCRRHYAREILIETNIDVFDSFFPLFESTLRTFFLRPGDDPAYPDGWVASVDRRHSTGQKEERIIAALEPVISSHRMVIDRAAITPSDDEPRDHSLQWQLTRIHKQRRCLKEDGKIDALAGAVSEFNDNLRVNLDKASQARREQEEDERDRRFREFINPGLSGPSPSFINRIHR